MKDGSNIFGNGNERYGNATLGFASDGWHLYAYGFRRATQILLEHAETRHTSLDVLVYPIVFLYRHHLELAIKLVAKDARMLLGDPPPPKPEHRLEVLWRDAKRLLARVESAEQVGLEQIDAVVSQIAAVDPISTAFRYPETLKGSRHLEEIRAINLFTLRGSLEPAFDTLDGIHTGLSIYLSQSAE